MRTLALSLALCGALAATAAAEPDAPSDARRPPTWTVRGFTVERWQGTESAATLASEPIRGGGLAVERRVLAVGLPGPFPVLDVTAELGFESGSTDGTAFAGQLDNHIGTWQITAGARARLPIFSWLLLQARGAIGGAHTSVRISDTSMSGVSDSGNGMVAAGGLSLSLLPRVTSRQKSAVHMGLEIELGYQVATAIALHAYPQDRPPEELTIPAKYASLGDLDLEGWTLRMAATIGF